MFKLCFIFAFLLSAQFAVSEDSGDNDQSFWTELESEINADVDDLIKALSDLFRPNKGRSIGSQFSKIKSKIANFVVEKATNIGKTVGVKVVNYVAANAEYTISAVRMLLEAVHNFARNYIASMDGETLKNLILDTAKIAYTLVVEKAVHFLNTTKIQIG